MKATGIVRRIDELGRVVIPKEIRRTYRIKEGTPLELYIGDSDEVILKKFSPILEIVDFANEIADTIFSVLSVPVVITDKDKVIACVGLNKAQTLNSKITSNLEKILEKRLLITVNKNEEKILQMFENDINQNSFLVSPIIANSDICGSIIIFTTDNNMVKDTDRAVVKSLSMFLSKQID